MQINAEIPLAHIIGVEIKATLPGRNAIELKMFDCNIPLPPESVDGRAALNLTLHTTEGDIQLGPVAMLPCGLQPFKVKGYIAEEILHRALTGQRELTLAQVPEPSAA